MVGRKNGRYLESYVEETYDGGYGRAQKGKEESGEQFFFAELWGRVGMGKQSVVTTTS